MDIGPLGRYSAYFDPKAPLDSAVSMGNGGVPVFEAVPTAEWSRESPKSNVFKPTASLPEHKQPRLSVDTPSYPVVRLLHGLHTDEDGSSHPQSSVQLSRSLPWPRSKTLYTLCHRRGKGTETSLLAYRRSWPTPRRDYDAGTS